MQRSQLVLPGSLDRLLRRLDLRHRRSNIKPLAARCRSKVYPDCAHLTFPFFLRQGRSNPWANLAAHALEEAKPPQSETTATRPTTPNRRHPNPPYCSSFT